MEILIKSFYSNELNLKEVLTAEVPGKQRKKKRLKSRMIIVESIAHHNKLVSLIQLKLAAVIQIQGLHLQMTCRDSC
jgi:hypothetical protein